jgi:hypothetical protein
MQRPEFDTVNRVALWKSNSIHAPCKKLENSALQISEHICTFSGSKCWIGPVSLPQLNSFTMRSRS